jgi:hypothetical protein
MANLEFSSTQPRQRAVRAWLLDRGAVHIASAAQVHTIHQLWEPGRGRLGKTGISVIGIPVVLVAKLEINLQSWQSRVHTGVQDGNQDASTVAFRIFLQEGDLKFSRFTLDSIFCLMSLVSCKFV